MFDAPVTAAPLCVAPALKALDGEAEVGGAAAPPSGDFGGAEERPPADFGGTEELPPEPNAAR
jgi:hypothetical protein